MIDSITSNPRIRLGVYILLGILTVAVIALSFVQLWVLNSATDVSGWGSVAANDKGFPGEDQRGAFILLNDNHNPIFTGNVVMLLATTDPGVVDSEAGAHLQSSEIKALLIQSAALNEPEDYRVYRLGDPNTEPMKYDRQPGGKDLLITPQSGSWKPGNYIVDIPADGMYGGRTYFQFYVDEQPQK